MVETHKLKEWYYTSYPNKSKKQLMCTFKHCSHGMDRLVYIYFNRYIEINDGYGIAICNSCFISGVIRIGDEECDKK